LIELWTRTPGADRYALFQDDVIFVKGLRTYLNRDFPIKPPGYLNLYTTTHNEWTTDFEKGWHEGRVSNPHSPDSIRSQLGKGALGLVFDYQAMNALMTAGASFMLQRTQDSDLIRGRGNIDGAVVTTMNRAGWREYVHNPSLCQHIGVECSVMKPGRQLTPATTFPGENFDATSLLPR